MVRKSSLRKTGVYILRNTLTGRVYVGATKDASEREWSHFGKLGRGVHDCKELQSDFDEMGRECFEFLVVEECTASELHNVEQKHSDLYFNKYNKRSDVRSNNGVPHSLEVRAILKEKRTGEKNPFFGKRHTKESNAKRSLYSGEKHAKAKIILNLETGVYYFGAGEASKAIDIKKATLTNYLNGTYPNKTSMIYA